MCSYRFTSRLLEKTTLTLTFLLLGGHGLRTIGYYASSVYRRVSVKDIYLACHQLSCKGLESCEEWQRTRNILILHFTVRLDHPEGGCVRELNQFLPLFLLLFTSDSKGSLRISSERNKGLILEDFRFCVLITKEGKCSTFSSKVIFMINICHECGI